MTNFTPKLTSCAECGKEFYPSHTREVCCSAPCKETRKAAQIKASNNTRRRPLSRKRCVVCGTDYMPTTGTQVCCSAQCSAERVRQRAKAEQRKLRKAMTNVEAAATMAKDAAGTMLQASTVEELEHAFESSVATVAASLKKLRRAKQAQILTDNHRAAADAVEQGFKELTATLLAVSPQAGLS